MVVLPFLRKSTSCCPSTTITIWVTTPGFLMESAHSRRFMNSQKRESSLSLMQDVPLSYWLAILRLQKLHEISSRKTSRKGGKFSVSFVPQQNPLTNIQPQGKYVLCPHRCGYWRSRTA